MKYCCYHFTMFIWFLVWGMIFSSPTLAQVPALIPNELKEVLPDELVRLNNDIISEIKREDKVSQSKPIQINQQIQNTQQHNEIHKIISPEDIVFPKLKGRVVDDANILSSSTEKELSRLSQTVEPFQFVIATVSSLQGFEIEEYGYRLGRHWQIGSKEKNDGLILLLAPNEKQVRIEVGYGLEGVMTDAVSSLITQKISSDLEQELYDNALLTGAREIVSLLQTEKEIFVQPKKKEGMPYGFALSLLTFIFFCYVAMAPSGQRGLRIRKLLFIFTLTSGIKGGFKGKGGSFGGGGATKRWK